MYAHDGHKSLLRLVAYLLVLSVVMSCLPVYTRSTSLADETQSSTQTNTAQPDIFFDRVKLYADGEEARYKEITWDSHLTLTAKYEGGDENVDVYTWQIYDPLGCSWVAINSADDAQLKVGAALLSGMTDETGVAVLNCKITADGALYYSDTIQILLLSGEEEADEPLEAAQSAETGAAARRSRAAASNAVTDDGTAGGELITYTVTVEYMNYITNSEASKPYIATVKPNTTNLTVFPDSPTVAGFTPYIITKGGIKGAPLLTEGEDNAVSVYEYIDENGVLQQIYGIETHKLELNLSAVTADETYQIVYLPNEVYYTVSHYVQNIVNDDYVLYYVETKQGYVGQMTEATNLTKNHPTNENGTPPLAEGFTALVPFKNQTIAADGTTQINVYYDRLYYLMTYILDGGRGTEPVYARYGATVHTTDPERTGYTFVGWVKLEMQDAMRALASPRPAVDSNGEYIPLLTDANGVVQSDKNGLIRLTKGTDGKYYGPDGTEYTPLSSDVMPKTMPAYHSASLALWKQADTEYTVVYWLENADYQATAEDPEIKYDYWCAVTRDAESGYNLSQIYAELENPLLTAEGYQPDGYYLRETDIDLDSLDKRSFALVANRDSRTLLTDSSSDSYGRLGGNFDSKIKTVEWTFEKVDTNTYKLQSGGKYLQMDGNNLYWGDESNATSFELGTQANYPNCITFKKVGTTSYIDRYSSDKIAAYDHSGDYETNQNIAFQLYSYTTPAYVPAVSGTGASALLSYERYLPADTNAFAQQGVKSFALVAYSNTAKSLSATATTDGLAVETFDAASTKQLTQWEFIASGTGYKLCSGGKYLQADANNNLVLTESAEEATVFTLSLRDNSNAAYAGAVLLSYQSGTTTYYLNAYGGSSASYFTTWTGADNGSTFWLYSFTAQVDDPESDYYYYYYSDFRDPDSDAVKDITVSSDGKTTVNVYFRRQEYNLRFFYARSYMNNGAKQYQVIGGSSYGFSKNDESTTAGLLKAIEKEIQEACGAWGDVAQPIYTNKEYYEDSEFTIDLTLDDGVTYTYYALILKARYGQDIADEWPSEVFSPVERTNPDTNDFTTKATFSGWNGEYWLKYSRDQYRKAQSEGTNANYTIKGNYQVVDENLLCDPSFSDQYSATDRDENGAPYGTYFERGTGSRYLDFVAFWENGNSTTWSIPRQFHYYLWVEAQDQSDAAKEKAIAEAQQRIAEGKQKALYIKNYGAYDEYLPHSDAEFKLAEEGVTTAIIGGTLYILYDKVDACDNSLNPAKQTVPGIPGYDYVGTEVTDTKDDNINGYAAYSAAMDEGKYYYQNDSFDTTLYQNSYTLNFAYRASSCSITLQSWNHIKKLEKNIVYNSMVGANWITGQYANDPEYDYDPGYMYDSMMKNYYPADLPEGAYYFAGWYKTKDYIPGTEADFTKPMPNYNIMLYAKWEPIRFDVEVYQTSDRNQPVYYPLSDEEDAEHGKMQALVVKETVLIHGQEVIVGKEGTGKGYNEYLPDVVPVSGPDKTYEVDAEGRLIPTIAENCSPLDYHEGTGQIRSDWIFVCYAYMKDGVEHAIDVSSFTITEDVQIYAKWTAVNILDYRVEYVMADLEVLVQESTDGPKETLWAKRHRLDEKGQPLYENGQLVYEMKDGEPDYQQVDFNAEGKLVFADGVEWIPTAKTVLQNEIKTNHVADPVVGKVNEGANRTFTAKTGLELYEEYRQGWFPVYVNHTALMQYGDLCTCCDTPVLMGSDEAHPLVTTFYYVPMTYVAYTVRYLDKLGNTLYKEKIVEDNIEMVVTEKYVFCSGYVPDAFQKTMVLSAYDEANVITFVYEKSDGKVPYTIQYYYETLGSVWDEPNVNGKNYLLHHELSGSVDPDGPLSVDYLDITGFEYSADVITLYTQQDLSEWTEQENNTRGEKNNIATGKSALELTDLRGHTVKAEAKDGKVVYTSADGHNHDLNNSVFTYEGYQVKAIRNVSGLLVIDGYANPTGSFTLKNEGTKVELGEYGTVIKVYYDLKLYPYYIIHKIDGADGEELGVELNVAKFQSNVSGTAMTDAQLIEAGWAGYTAREDNKSITITITIQDDGSTPHINTITFLYYEKMMEFDYVPRLLKNPGMEGSAAVVVDMPENEPNAQINLVRDYIKTATGTADAAHPVIYENAYEFLGWFLDPECTKPVANSGAAVYLGTDYTQEDGISTLVGQLTGNQGNMTQDQYKLYDTLLPQKKKADYQYISDGKLTTTDLESGVYVGAFNKETGVYEQQEAFYALFAPKLGSLTITRQNLGANFHNEANSFVYTVQGSDGFTMQVTIGPEDFVVNGVVQTSASVVITNLPIGEYTVTQAEDWSWRYKAETYSVTFTGSDLFQTAAFGGEMTKGSWLSGFADTLKNVVGIN